MAQGLARSSFPNFVNLTRTTAILHSLLVHSLQGSRSTVSDPIPTNLHLPMCCLSLLYLSSLKQRHQSDYPHVPHSVLQIICLSTSPYMFSCLLDFTEATIMVNIRT
jgi:hypothetical protein